MYHCPQHGDEAADGEAKAEILHDLALLNANHEENKCPGYTVEADQQPRQPWARTAVFDQVLCIG